MTNTEARDICKMALCVFAIKRGSVDCLNPTREEILHKSVEDFDIRTMLEALEKQIPKKTMEVEETDQRWVEVGFNCPSCDNVIFRYDGDYCSNCGQRIDWSADDD